MKFKQIIAFLLLIGVIANCFNYLIIESSYNFNKSYISQVLCTNNDKPHLNCNGKCFLDIKIKELDQKNKKEQEHLKHIVETTAPYFVEFCIKNAELELPRTTIFYLQEKPSAFPLIIFQPPKLV